MGRSMDSSWEILNMKMIEDVYFGGVLEGTLLWEEWEDEFE